IPNERRHALIVAALAMRVKAAPPLVPAQVSIELWMDVVQLMEDGDEFFVKVLVQESRHAEHHMIEDLAAIHEIALDAIKGAAPVAKETASLEPQGRDSCLQAVSASGSSPGHADEQARGIDVP